jgi:2-phospho-L-lactate/phosphoenolpyruvate guanylyltransferase
MILVPVKDLRHAKQRLASVLSQPDRTALARAMVRDVLGTLASCPTRPIVAVITSDAYAMQLALGFGFQVISDALNLSQTDAVAMATAVCHERGEMSTLVIPGDIPLVSVSELQNIFESAPSMGSLLVPAADGRGTNAVYRSPADLFPLRFGNDSFKPHLAAARGTGYPCVVLSLPGIALDIDNPDDLRALAAAPGNTHSQQLIRQWDLREYALASNE